MSLVLLVVEVVVVVFFVAPTDLALCRSRCGVQDLAALSAGRQADLRPSSPILKKVRAGAAPSTPAVPGLASLASLVSEGPQRGRPALSGAASLGPCNARM